MAAPVAHPDALLQTAQEEYDVFANRLQAALAAMPRGKGDQRKKWDESCINELKLAKKVIIKLAKSHPDGAKAVTRMVHNKDLDAAIYEMKGKEPNFSRLNVAAIDKFGYTFADSPPSTSDLGATPIWWKKPAPRKKAGDVKKPATTAPDDPKESTVNPPANATSRKTRRQSAVQAGAGTPATTSTAATSKARNRSVNPAATAPATSVAGSSNTARGSGERHGGEGAGTADEVEHLTKRTVELPVSQESGRFYESPWRCARCEAASDEVQTAGALVYCIIDRAQGKCVLCINRKTKCPLKPAAYWYGKGGKGKKRMAGATLWNLQIAYVEEVRGLLAANPQAPIPPPTWAEEKGLGTKPHVSPYFGKWTEPLDPPRKTTCPRTVHYKYEAYAADNTDRTDGSGSQRLSDDSDQGTTPAPKRTHAEVSPTASEAARKVADGKKARTVGFAGVPQIQGSNMSLPSMGTMAQQMDDGFNADVPMDFAPQTPPRPSNVAGSSTLVMPNVGIQPLLPSATIHDPPATFYVPPRAQPTMPVGHSFSPDPSVTTLISQTLAVVLKTQEDLVKLNEKLDGVVSTIWMTHDRLKIIEGAMFLDAAKKKSILKEIHGSLNKFGTDFKTLCGSPDFLGQKLSALEAGLAAISATLNVPGPSDTGEPKTTSQEMTELLGQRRV